MKSPLLPPAQTTTRLKQTLLPALLLMLASCGSDGKPATEKAANAPAATVVIHDTVPGNRAQDEVFNNEISDLPSSLSRFVPEGYTALDTAGGDLNLDQYTDMILVLKQKGEDTASDDGEHPAKRPLLILLGQADQSYEMAARSDNAVYCVHCGGMMGDPFTQVTIKNGYFSVEHYGGSSWKWTRIITFKYNPTDHYWYLHKDGGDSFHASDPEKVTTKVQTTKDFGKVRFDAFDIYKEE